MTDRKIMYVCADCFEHAPEGCGHFDRNDLAVMPNGTWLCEDCTERFDTLEACGVTPRGTEEDAEWPVFAEFPKPSEYRPIEEAPVTP